VVADSAQLSTGFTKLSEEAYRGTALTFQTGLALDNHCSHLNSTCPGCFGGLESSVRHSGQRHRVGQPCRVAIALYARIGGLPSGSALSVRYDALSLILGS